MRPETLYKIIWKEQWEQIQATGGLIPQPQRGRGLAGMSGNWTVEARSLGAWTRPTKYFGSALQALLFGTMRSKRARGAAGKPVTDAVLLEIKVAPDDALLVRNLAPVFDRLDAAPYYASLKPLEAHVARAASRDIPEILIETPVPLERLRAVSVVAESRLPDWGVISRFRVDPARLLAGLRDPASGPLAVATSGKRVRFTGGLVVGLARYMLKPMESVLAWAILAPGAFAASFAVNLARAPRALAFSARLMPRHSAMPKAAKAFMFAVGFPVFAPLLGMVVNPMKESLQAVKAGHGAWREGGFRAGFAAAVAQVSRQNQVFLAKERFMTVALSTQREPVALRLALSAYLGALAWASASLALSWAWLAPVLLSAAVVEVFAAAFVLAASDKG
ncbi:MAG: hypothetical protein HYZ74_00260 [Elusimicrobia bacterium]|nr:hypothetical protein [Elusimicrobiota bacterium]